MHGVNQDQTVVDTAFLNASLHLPRDIDERDAGRRIKPQFFAIAFHEFTPNDGV
jgi:hypothetical protein